MEGWSWDTAKASVTCHTDNMIIVNLIGGPIQIHVGVSTQLVYYTASKVDCWG